jgi:hypothetical protein
MYEILVDTARWILLAILNKHIRKLKLTNNIPVTLSLQGTETVFGKVRQMHYNYHALHHHTSIPMFIDYSMLITQSNVHVFRFSTRRYH